MSQPPSEPVMNVNPVYDNKGYQGEDEYAVVQKKSTPAPQPVGPPIIPVIVPAEDGYEPKPDEPQPDVYIAEPVPEVPPQEPEPVIITEPIMSEEPEVSCVQVASVWWRGWVCDVGVISDWASCHWEACFESGILISNLQCQKHGGVLTRIIVIINRISTMPYLSEHLTAQSECQAAQNNNDYMLQPEAGKKETNSMYKKKSLKKWK